jgi:hypothetical protein
LPAELPGDSDACFTPEEMIDVLFDRQRKYQAVSGCPAPGMHQRLQAGENLAVLLVEVCIHSMGNSISLSAMVLPLKALKLHLTAQR